MRAKRIYESEDISVVAATLDELEKDNGENMASCVGEVNLPDGDYDAHIKGWEAVIENPDNPDDKIRLEMDRGIKGKLKGIVMVRGGEANILLK